MNMWRVGEDMGSKETDGCPLTITATPEEVKENKREVAEYTQKDYLVQQHIFGTVTD
jgi:hypothetical protein